MQDLMTDSFSVMIKFLKHHFITLMNAVLKSINRILLTIFGFIFLQGNDTFERFIKAAERGVQVSFFFTFVN